MPEEGIPKQAYWYELPLALLVIAIFVSGLAYFSWRSHKKQRPLLLERIRQRHGQNKETFAAFFQDRQVPAIILDCVYDFFQRWMGEDFPILPADKISDLANEFDLEFQNLVKKCGRRLPSKHKYEDTFQMDTIEDVVLFLTACPISEQVPC